jgi:hypothetical protein
VKVQTTTNHAIEVAQRILVERGRATIEWWSSLGSAYIRLSAIPLLVLGSIVAYACAPD